MRASWRRAALLAVIVVLAIPSIIESLGHRTAAAAPIGAAAFAALLLVVATLRVPDRTGRGGGLPEDGESDVIIAGVLLFLGGWLAIGATAQLPFGTLLYRPDLVGLALLATGTICLVAGSRTAIILLPSVAIACLAAVPATVLVALGSRGSAAVAGGVGAFLVAAVVVVAPPRRRLVVGLMVAAVGTAMVAGAFVSSVATAGVLGALLSLLVLAPTRVGRGSAAPSVVLPEHLAPRGRLAAGLVALIGTVACTATTFAAPAWSVAAAPTRAPAAVLGSYTTSTGVAVTGWEVAGDAPNRRVELVVASGKTFSSVASLPPAMLVDLPTAACPNDLVFHHAGATLLATLYPEQSTGESWQIDASVRRTGRGWQQVDVISALGPAGGPVPLLTPHFRPLGASVAVVGDLLTSRRLVCEPAPPTGVVARVIAATTRGGVVR